MVKVRGEGGGFREFRHLKRALTNLIKLSHFDDDAEFVVKVGKALPVSQKVKAPSKIVLEHALWRAGVENATVSRAEEGQTPSDSSTRHHSR